MRNVLIAAASAMVVAAASTAQAAPTTAPLAAAASRSADVQKVHHAPYHYCGWTRDRWGRPFYTCWWDKRLRRRGYY